MSEQAVQKAYRGRAGRAHRLSDSRTKNSYDTIDVKPAAPMIGGYVSGVDLRNQLSSRQVDDLSHALADHNVLFFRDQPELTPVQQIAFAQNFGKLHIHPAAPHLDGHPEVYSGSQGCSRHFKIKVCTFSKNFGFSSVTRSGSLRSVSKCQKSILRAILRRNTCPGRLLTLPESNFREK